MENICFSEVTCLKCGWVHINVSKKDSGNRTTCFRCKHDKFRYAALADAPAGCTIQPVTTTPV